MFVIAIAVSFGENQLVTHHDADADAGPIPILQDLGHVVVEAVQLFRDVDVLRVSGRRQDEARKRDYERDSF